jgi:hypothetical protein
MNVNGLRSTFRGGLVGRERCLRRRPRRLGFLGSADRDLLADRDPVLPVPVGEGKRVTRVSQTPRGEQPCLESVAGAARVAARVYDAGAGEHRALIALPTVNLTGPETSFVVHAGLVTCTFLWLRLTVLVTVLQLTSSTLPGGPCGPLAPAAPCGPLAPVGPCGPVAPVDPWGPVGPWGPGGRDAWGITVTAALVADVVVCSSA